MNHNLNIAVNAALLGDWHSAHHIVQKYNDANANWLHAILHKMEDDEWNSKYWYAKTDGKQYEDYADANMELIAIQNWLARHS
ncbi:MAG: hypothetical protein Q8M99_10285 [Methylotenera sp.]|nr:hypothetical protein [Methylotenera sp.]